MRSPFVAIAAYERELGLPVDYINTSIVGYGSHGAWQKFERGEIGILDFYSAFGRELSDTVHGNKCYREYCRKKGLPCPPLPEYVDIKGRDLFGAMMRASQSYDPYIREAVLRIRAAGTHRVIALTNNFAKVDVPAEELRFLGWDEGVIPDHLRNLFDDFCDSSALGMRKPEPEFYLAACERSNIKPFEAIFLDDIGLNLKAAKALGMGTIHVRIGHTLEAVKELEVRIGIKLTEVKPDSRI